MIRVEYQAAVPDWVRRTIDAFIISIVPRAEGLLVLGNIDLSQEPDGSELSLRADGTFNGEHRNYVWRIGKLPIPATRRHWDKRRRELARGLSRLLGLKRLGSSPVSAPVNSTAICGKPGFLRRRSPPSCKRYRLSPESSFITRD